MIAGRDVVSGGRDALRSEDVFVVDRGFETVFVVMEARGSR